MTELQELLRFLTRSASLPLATAMRLIPALQRHSLNSAAAIASAKLDVLHTSAFSDVEDGMKLAKQVRSAALRNDKKRSAGLDNDAPTVKKRKTTDGGDAQSKKDFEASLILPKPVTDIAILSSTVLITNRAPLVLAFAVVLLGYTMPKQPLSSRLSLAQAVVSANSRTKARHLGIEDGNDAEDEVEFRGQPVVKVMNREVKVVKRGDPEEPRTRDLAQDSQDSKDGPTNSGTVVGDVESEPALWGLDTEASKKHKVKATSTSGIPIHTPQAARAYLLKSFTMHNDPAKAIEPPKSSGQKTSNAKQEATAREQNLALLLGALQLLFESWSKSVSFEELDRGAWGWYVTVRPQVEDGVAGWGGKGKVKLSEILKLRKDN